MLKLSKILTIWFYHLKHVDGIVNSVDPDLTTVEQISGVFADN